MSIQKKKKKNFEEVFQHNPPKNPKQKKNFRLAFLFPYFPNVPSIFWLLEY